MADITIEQAIALRDTISLPTFIINNLLHNEGMDTYADMACVKILELADEHPEYKDDIYLDIMEFNVRVTLFGFWLVKDILLSYISEEKYQEYMHYLQLKNEQVRSWNSMTELLMGFDRKQLIKTLKEINDKIPDKDNERIQSYIRAELKARSIKNRLRKRIMHFVQRSKISIRALKIKSWISKYKNQQCS